MTSRVPSMADGEAWWSTMAVVPASRASTAPSSADHRTSSRSRAASTRHQIRSRISVKLVGVAGGGGMPRASVEYRWWWAQTSPGVVAVTSAARDRTAVRPPGSRTSMGCGGAAPEEERSRLELGDLVEDRLPPAVHHLVGTDRLELVARQSRQPCHHVRGRE